MGIDSRFHFGKENYYIGFMNKISEDIGWNNCIEYIIKNLDDFQNRYLDGGEYDYFPDTELEKWLRRMKKS